MLFLWGTTLFLAARGCLEGVVVVIGDCWMVLVAVLDFGGGDGSGFGLVVVVTGLVGSWDLGGRGEVVVVEAVCDGFSLILIL